MRVSLNWLKDYVKTDLTPEDLAKKLTMLGLEIEAVERPGADISKVVVGQIASIDPHPNADKLVVCKTDVGQGEPLQIVCGATNMQPGDKVPTAVVGGTLVGGFTITKRKMRGVESHGMMCAPDELGLGDDHAGLLLLNPDIPVGADAKPYLGLDDVVFDIEVIPNRGDWASMIGVARELAALLAQELTLPQVQVTESGPPAAELSSVTNDAADLCPRYCGRIVTGVRIGPSPQWLCNRLVAAGMRPINNVVDITNYVLLETGHPLHAFDYNLLAEKRIVVRRAKPGEPMTTLDGQQHTLEPEMLVIADAAKPQALAGIMGGEHSEVGERTTDIFLESAYFDPISIRRTARACNLVTESSQRFQRGADPEMARYAIDRAAQLMHELADGTVAPGVIDAYPDRIIQREVRLRYERNNAVLGVDVAAADQRAYLARLGFEPIKEDNEGVTWQVPTWRHDVTQEADLIEEVARLYGYNNIPATLPRVRPVEKRFAPEDKKLRELRRFLVALGLTEVYHWTFSCSEEVNKAKLPAHHADMVALQNPLSERHAAMRTTLIPGLLSNVAHNLNRGVRAISTFELGPVYVPVAGRQLPRQLCHLGVAMCGIAGANHWSTESRRVDLFDLKGIVESLADYAGADLAIRALDAETFQPGQAAEVVIGGECLGQFGKVAEPVADAFDIEHDVFLLELTVDVLLHRTVAPATFTPVPAFPASLRDMAVLVDEEVPAGDLCAAAQKAGGKLLHSVSIFDVYTGKQIPPGKKSVALEFVFQSPERTLTDKDTQKAWDKILRSLENQFSAELR
ncbi:MAG: phenylalanine--tRNA ligase subunit beta [Candidatus Hydrogenedentota bacterium]